ncbi:MAG: Tat pathway signal protein, partial [Betaproteobacteria bacterium]
GQLGLAGAAAPGALNLAAMSEAAAQSSTANDYKALVCVFLYGGNDHYNTIVPFDDINHANYQRVRSGITLQRSALTANALPIGTGEGLASTVNGMAPGRQVALAPELSGLVPLFNKGELGVIFNIGTLVQPTTKAQYTAANVPLP